MSLTMACDLIVAAEFGGLEEAGLGWILFFSRTLGTRGNTGSEGLQATCTFKEENQVSIELLENQTRDT